MVLSKMATVGRSALGAKRALFGPVDHSALKVRPISLSYPWFNGVVPIKGFLKDALAKQRKVLDDINKRRWNFDFAKDTPLNGPYKWAEVTGSSEVRSPHISTLKSALNAEADPAERAGMAPPEWPIPVGECI